MKPKQKPVDEFRGHVDYAVDVRDGYKPIFNGKLGQVLQNEKGYEYYRRAPGIRAIIPTESGLVMIKEKREENSWESDIRLPGGKVADTLIGYLNFLEAEGKDQASNHFYVLEALDDELKEEAGIIATTRAELHEGYYTSGSAASVEWDLHYFIVKEYKRSKARPGHGEKIRVIDMTFQQVFDACIARKIKEDRTRAVLFEYLLTFHKDKIRIK